MSGKRKNTKGGIVYSTDPGFNPEPEEQEPTTPHPSEQKLKVRLDTKYRKGKTVTLVEGFTGKNEDLVQLGKTLKSQCGTGGTAKDGVILIQGNYLEKIKNSLKKMGYGI